MSTEHTKPDAIPNSHLEDVVTPPAPHGAASANDDGLSRRSVLSLGAAITGGALLLGAPRVAQAQTQARPRTTARDWMTPGMPKRDYQPVVVPNGSKLPWKIVDGVKVFHLVAEEVEHTFAEGLKARCWGYNGRVHGPVIEAVEGDRVRIYVTNRLEAATTVHWHGLFIPSGMDGVGGLNQRAIRTGETYRYEFTLKQHGTYMYHSHHDEMTQMAMGMVGMIVVHPRKRVGPKVDRDFAIMLHEWKIEPGASRPDPNEMTDFNVLTMNAAVFPATESLVVQKGQRVRLRFGNLSAMDHHPIHLHGYAFNVTETDGGRIPTAGQWPETTVLVPTGSTRTVEFVADVPGDWAMHCHMTHHVMNQMGHDFTNMIGVDAKGLDAKVRKVIPGYMTMGQTGMDMSAHAGHMKMPDNSIPMLGGKGPHDEITMGGMFTILKVRDRLNGYADPGWYDAPAETVATNALAADLARDGIDPAAPPAALPGAVNGIGG